MKNMMKAIAKAARREHHAVFVSAINDTIKLKAGEDMVTVMVVDHDDHCAAVTVDDVPYVFVMEYDDGYFGLPRSVGDTFRGHQGDWEVVENGSSEHLRWELLP